MTYYNKLAAGRQPVIVEALRTPFLKSGGLFAEFRHHELAAQPIKALLDKTGVEAEAIQMLTVGQVVQELDTTNVAREAGLVAGLPSRVPAYSISMAGISPAVGFAHICDMIALGRMDIAIAGGSENFSDIPIRLNRNVRRRAVGLAQAKSASQRLKIAAGLRPTDLLPELPSSKDLTTGLTMGAACEIMVERFAVTRAEADELAARSHQNAEKAWAGGKFADDVIATTNPKGQTATVDNSFRSGTTVENLSRLAPAFGGVITAGNASGITDGATAQLLMSTKEAKRRKLTPLAKVVDYEFIGTNSLHSGMLLGPAMSVPTILARNGLSLDDIAIFELHEAFAAQIIANQKALASTEFAISALGHKQAVGAIPSEKLNCWGGSVALGNPFAGTGGRLLSTAARRLRESGERYALTATCAGGGLGAAILLENPQY